MIKHFLQNDLPLMNVPEGFGCDVDDRGNVLTLTVPVSHSLP
jgi:hypothetical protein